VALSNVSQVLPADGWTASFQKEGDRNPTSLPLVCWALVGAGMLPQQNLRGIVLVGDRQADFADLQPGFSGYFR
jgi:hypothetical protein